MNKRDQPPPYSQHDLPPPAGFVHPDSMPTAPISVVRVTPVNYGPLPQNLMCPHCHANIRSMVESQPSTKTHIAALLLCIFCFLPCAVIPYCMDSCQNINHYCPNCKAYLGFYDS